MRILLVEPDYITKYPPLGLMKISSYHKNQGDEVIFYKGMSAEIRAQVWDVVYVTTLFTFQWKKVVDTIKFYQKKQDNIKVGGILATLMSDELEAETGIKPHRGLWDEVDNYSLDYSLTASNTSIGYMTRGCPNRCPFCAVYTLEPNYIDYIPLKPQIDVARKDLVLWDNNILASPKLKEIVDEIKLCGFGKGARLGRAQRELDFNQGVDARLFTEGAAELLSQLAIKKLRFAFDDIKLKDIYVKAVTLAHRYGFKLIEPYVLYNYKDTPKDFYQRLQVNVELHEELGINIFAFPMCFIPLDAKDRSYISPNWTRNQVLRVKDILNVTFGGVGSKRAFFEKAWGKDATDFEYIINQTKEWVRGRGDKTKARKNHSMTGVDNE